MVVLHARRDLPLGAVGVDLFFVISGFIMARVSRGREPGQFLFDRFWRIYPLWWIAVVPWLLWVPPDWRVLLSSLTLWPLYGEMIRPALSVGWTLLFEILFYMAVALSLRIGVKPVLAFFAVMLIGGVIDRSSPVFDYFGNPMIFEFLFGVAIALAPRSTKHAFPLLIFALITLAFAPEWASHPEFALDAPRSAWRVLYWGVPAAMIVYSCLSLEQWFQGWTVPLLLGDASYSIYLFHPALMEIPVPWPLRALIAVAGGVAAWWLIEKRIIAAKPRFRKLVAAIARPS